MYVEDHREETVEDSYDAAEAPSDEPKTWASMAAAATLKPGVGAGKLAATSRGKGFSLPAAPKTGIPFVPGLPVLPPPDDRKVKALAAPVAKGITGLPPPRPTQVNGAAASASTPDASVRMWMSRIPLEPAVATEELVNWINEALSQDGSSGRAVTVDRSDGKETAYLTVSSADAAADVVRLSKGRKLQGLKVEYDRKSPDRWSGTGAGAPGAEVSEEPRGWGGGGKGGGKASKEKSGGEPSDQSGGAKGWRRSGGKGWNKGSAHPPQ